MEDKDNINLHNSEDDSLELERNFEDSTVIDEEVVASDDSSVLSSDKPDEYIENLWEEELAQAEAEAEAELKKEAKRKKDKENARKKDKEIQREAHERYEREMAAENERRLRAESERFQNNNSSFENNEYRSSETVAPSYESSSSFENKTVPAYETEPVGDSYHYEYSSENEYSSPLPESEQLRRNSIDDEIEAQQKLQRERNQATLDRLNQEAIERQRSSENYKSFGNQGIDYSGNDQHTAYVTPDYTAPTSGTVLSETELQTIKTNYEESKAAFKSYGDDVPQSVVEQYRKDSETYFSTQRGIDEGTVSVSKEHERSVPQSAPVGDSYGSSVSSSSVSQEPRSDERHGTTIHAQRDDGQTSSGQTSSNQNTIPPTSHENRDYLQPDISAQIRANPRALNLLLQNMAYQASEVYEQSKNFSSQQASTSASFSSPTSSGSSSAMPSSEKASGPRTYSISQERYDSLKNKCAESAKEIASYGSGEVPQSVLQKNEQLNKVLSSVNEKIKSGTVTVSSESSGSSTLGYDGNKKQSRSSSASAPKQNGAAGTQVFTDRSKDNFAPGGKRIGDSHTKPVGTPFQGQSLGKYDKLKIYNSHNYTKPFEIASRQTLGALGGAVVYAARSEQTGTVNTMVTARQGARDVVSLAKTLADTPRQIKEAYYTASNCVTAARNVGRILTGRELLSFKEHAPLTIKQIDKQLQNPFSSKEMPKMQKKFGSNTTASAFSLNTKIAAKTALNKDLKSQIKSLQAKGAALTGEERKQLKALMEQKKVADQNLRNLHGAKRAQAEARNRNRAADKKATNTDKTIKKNSKKGVKLSKEEKKVLAHLVDKKDLLEKRKKLLGAKGARKQLLMSAGNLLGKAAREGDDSTIQGLLNADRFLQNRHVRSVLKFVTKPILLPAKLAANAAKKAASVVATKVVEKTVVKTTKIFNKARNSISSRVPDKIKTRVDKNKQVLDDLKAKRNAILDKFKALKERLKNSKIGKFVSSISNGLKNIFSAFSFAKKILVRVGLTCGGFVILFAILGAMVTSVGGVASSFFLGDDGDNGKINLTSYVDSLNDEEEEFLKEIDKLASDPDDKYTNIEVHYQNGVMVNNFKEILSMTAVYFDQNFTNRSAVDAYIVQLYKDSHYYVTEESEPYACSGCVDRSYKCTDSLPSGEGVPAATPNRIRLYNNFHSRGGCTVSYKSRSYKCTSSYPADASYTRISLYNSYSDRGGCQENTDEDGKTTYSCPGHSETYATYRCDGHTESICYGDHIDLDINVMVLSFDDIFYADSSVNSSISGVDTSTGNVTKGAEIGTFTITYYCTERYPHICNAGPPYKTASGTEVTPGRTIAVDKSVIPLGTHVIINGHEYIAEDTGGAIKGNRIDIAVATHAEALQNGKKTYKVYSTEEVGSSGSGSSSQSIRTAGLDYLNLATEAASSNATIGNKGMVLQLFGFAKNPVVSWSSGIDNVESYANKLNAFDLEHADSAFTSAELNTFEYVKMSKEELVALAKERTGKEININSVTVYGIIEDTLIPYDKNHPNDYLKDPESSDSQNFYFAGWNQENQEIAKNICENMTSDVYNGLEDINQFSKDNVSYEGITFTQGETNVVYYNQYDARWKNLPYGSSTIGNAGCGPTSMAIVISSLTGNAVDPITMCNWSSSHGYYVDGVGTSWSFISGAASNWGLSCQNMGKGNAQQVVSALSEGKLVVMSTGSGSYYSGDGHFLVLRGVDENGRILVADPASKEKSETSWALSDITSGLKNWWIIG